jgi:hypothetical protein
MRRKRIDSRGSRVIAALLALWLTSVEAAAPAVAAEPEPASEVGEVSSGVELGDSGLWVGGYLTNTLSLLEDAPDALTLTDVGLLLRYQLTPTVSLFNETDLDDSVTWESGHGVEVGSRVLLLERLYADWQPRPDVTLRLGKFLTPFGLWNVVRRAPLTWTIESPLIAETIFPDHITGAAIGHQNTLGGWTFDATAYGQATDELVPGASDTVPRYAGGGRLSGGRDIGPAYLEFGASGVGFENEATDKWQDGFGTDFACTGWGNFLQAEFAYGRQLTAGADPQLGFYVQDAVPLPFPFTKTLWGVVRIDYLDPDKGPVVNGQLVGLTYRPLPWLVLKADYQFGNRSTDDLDRGFMAAVVAFF